MTPTTHTPRTWLCLALTLALVGCSTRGDAPAPLDAPRESAAEPVAHPAEAMAAESLTERVQGAERVVVASVASVSAAFGRNDYGDNLILSTVSLQVEDTLKGEASSSVSFELEGGTVGDLTLEVSDLPKLTAGERGVFVLRHNRAGTSWGLHRRGLGIMRVDAHERLPAVGMSLEAVREAVKVMP